MTRAVFILSFFLISLMLCSCSKTDNDNASNCDLDVIICPIQFANAPNDYVQIQSAEINDDCLKITYAASGCDGSHWSVILIDSSELIESNPPQRRLRLSLDNNEDCEALITQSKSFDISAIQSDAYNRIILNLDGFDGELWYDY